jgi:hypothetical protein
MHVKDDKNTREISKRNISTCYKIVSGLKNEITVVEIRHAYHVAPFIRKSWHLLRRQAAATGSV